MSTHFSSFLRTVIGDGEQREFAARCGISAPQLSKILHGQPCERTTLVKVIRGMGANPHLRADGMAAFLKDFLPLAGGAGDLVRISVRK